MNLFEIVGKVMNEPTVNESSTGVKMCKVKVALNSNKPNDTNESEIVEVALFRDLANTALKVGQQVAIDGRISSFKAERENNTYYNLGLIGNHIAIL